jgi:hypothetical protein
MSDICLNTEAQPEAMAGGIEFIYWLAKIGKSRPTGYRWRNKGMVKTVNVEGKLFVEDDEILRFWKRARNGEFAKKPRGAAARKRGNKTQR